MLVARSFVILAAGALIVSAVSSARAQLPQTRLFSIFPLGGKAGATLDLQLTGGADLDVVESLRFSHPGIKGTQKTQNIGGKQRPISNSFSVSIDAKVPAGVYEVRAAGLYGISNPRTFVVGSRDEAAEAEPNNSVDKAGTITLGSVVNGKVGGGADIDFFKFQGKKGQRVLVNCYAARIDSRLRAVVEVYNADGRRLGYSRNQEGRDPLVDVTLPADGEYYVKLYDFLFGGSASHVYRLTAHAGPHVDIVMPPSGLPGSKGKYTLYGRNLPGSVPANISIDGRSLEKVDVEISLPADGTTLQTA